MLTTPGSRYLLVVVNVNPTASLHMSAWDPVVGAAAPFDPAAYSKLAALMLPTRTTDGDGFVTLSIDVVKCGGVDLKITRTAAKLPASTTAGAAAPAPAAPASASAMSAPPPPELVEDPAANAKVISLLTTQLGAPSGSKWSTLVHEPTPTSEDSARVRGATLASGAKAMLLSCKPNDEFVLVVISAVEKMDSKAMKKAGSFKSTRFASVEEVMQVTGCVPGAVPPFGSCFGLRTFVDESLRKQGSTINFNAGLRTFSVSMSVDDYFAVERPTEVNVSS